MTTTGYSDTFGRTVSNGLGTATSGQPYTLSGAASQFSVAPNTASIAMAVAGDKIGYVDRQTSDIDITGQVALSAIPSTNLATAGLAAKLSNANNYYYASMMVASGGAVSIRFSRVIAGSLVTLSTTLVTGVTYVANTFYNLRFSMAWSRALQTNIMSAMLWVVGSNPPGGWMATNTDASFTDYTSGTQTGIVARDESSVVGSITAKFQNIAVRSYGLPMPATSDPMCYDPAVTYPRQTALQSLAVAADAAMATIDPLTSLAGLFPRARISNSNVVVNTASVFIIPTYNTTEFNVGTTTNLGFDNTALYLPVGVWLATFEIQLAEAASNAISVFFSGGAVGASSILMRTNPVQSNDSGVGGCGHVSMLVYSTDPTVSVVCSASLSPNNLATTYTIRYMALSAIKVSDYFA